MRIDILTLSPEMFCGAFDESVPWRAAGARLTRKSLQAMWNALQHQLMSMIGGLFTQRHERYPGDAVANIVCEIAEREECAQDMEWAFGFAESRLLRQDEPSQPPPPKS